MVMPAIGLEKLHVESMGKSTYNFFGGDLLFIDGPGCKGIPGF